MKEIRAGMDYAPLRYQRMVLPSLYYKSSRGQCATMLLAALHQLYLNDGFRTITKREAIDFIGRRHWFELRDDDYKPYPSQYGLSGEPRWHTLIAWARKDSVLRDLISYEERDAWGLTRLGRDAFEQAHELCQSGAQPVSPCFLWSAQFKRFMCSKHVPSSADARRPGSFYRDIWASLLIHLVRSSGNTHNSLVLPPS